jgi:cyclopropane fatty-acyl-phospholipid synthase-like methyltransferase
MSYTEPFVPIPEDVIPRMLNMAAVKRGELLYDLGSGDGRIPIVAARDFHARAVGVEIRKRLVDESRKRVKVLGLSGQVTIRRLSFRKVDLRKADVIATYLTGYILNSLTPKFNRELKPGARVVNFDYQIPDWTPALEVRVKPEGWKKEHPLYLYRV